MSAAIPTSGLMAGESPCLPPHRIRQDHAMETTRPNRYLIAAGGTGGHVIPALQVAKELRRRGAECLFVATGRGIEGRLVPAEGFELLTVEIGPLNRVSWATRLGTLLKLPKALSSSWRILTEQQPLAVLSLGGYASGPLVLAAALREVPVVVMEPNAVPGMANRLAAEFAKRALLGFGEAAGYFQPGVSEVVGVPVREEFLAIAPRAAGAAFTVLVTGGSQGASRLNEASIEFVARSTPDAEQHSTSPRLIHQAGRREYERVRKACPNVEVAPFFDDMPARFAEADLVVCRAGASALAELCAAGKPSILVPFPAAADNHQLLNARALEAAGAAVVVEDHEWDGERMLQEIEALRSSPGRLEAMASAARSMASAGSAGRSADIIEEVARASGGPC